MHSAYRAASRFAPIQWETVLLWNVVSHCNWLGASLESALSIYHEHYLELLTMIREQKCQHYGVLPTQHLSWTGFITQLLTTDRQQKNTIAVELFLDVCKKNLGVWKFYDLFQLKCSIMHRSYISGTTLNVWLAWLVKIGRGKLHWPLGKQYFNTLNREWHFLGI